MTAPRVIFAGTPEFALASLSALVAAGVVPVAVLTQPDRPAGRGRKLAQSPVKAFALEQGIEVWQPETLRTDEAVRQIARAQPDLLVVAAYGLLLPETVLSIPGLGCLNVHASLLPRWRGAAPIQAAILAGDAETGVCLMQMEAGLDSGPVYASVAQSIDRSTTAAILHDQLAGLGAGLLVDTLPDILAGNLVPEVQDESRATYAPRIRKSDAVIDWSCPAVAIERQVRAYNPVPGANFGWRDERIKCWRAEAHDGPAAAPGTVLAAGRQLDVACGQGMLRLHELQRPGRGRVTATELSSQIALLGQQLG